jgi:hypothetical protein
MRAALPAGSGGEAAPGTFRRFAAGLTANVLGGFMILGIVAAGGCGGDTTTVGDAAGDCDAPADIVRGHAR